MPHGTPRCRPYSIWRRTAAWQVWSSSVSSKLGITSSGIRYSNIEPLQDSSTGSPPMWVSGRPSANQRSCGKCALGDGDEARQPRLRGQQVVVAGVAAVLARRVADHQQVAQLVIQEREVRLGQVAGLLGKVCERRDAGGGAAAAVLDLRHQRLQAFALGRTGRGSRAQRQRRQQLAFESRQFAQGRDPRQRDRFLHPVGQAFAHPGREFVEVRELRAALVQQRLRPAPRLVRDARVRIGGERSGAIQQRPAGRLVPRRAVPGRSRCAACSKAMHGAAAAGAAPPCASSATPSVSPRPSSQRSGTIGCVASASSPARSVSSDPARLPQSTVDT